MNTGWSGACAWTASRAIPAAGSGPAPPTRHPLCNGVNARTSRESVYAVRLKRLTPFERDRQMGTRQIASQHRKEGRGHRNVSGAGNEGNR